MKSFAVIASLTNVPVFAVETRANGTLNMLSFRVGRPGTAVKNIYQKGQVSFAREDISKKYEITVNASSI